MGSAWRTLTIAVEDGVIEADIAGENVDGVPIIFLHGWTLDKRMWAPQLAAISAHRPVISIDRRGFGRTTAPPDLALEADDILAVQNHFLVDACVIAGMSQGGRVALDLALNHSQRVRALILQGASLSGFSPPQRVEEAIPVDAYRALVEVGKIDEMRQHWRDHPYMQTPSPAAAKQIDEILKSYDGRDLLTASSQLAVGPDDIGRIAMPTLVVTGDHETPWLRLVGDAIAYGVPNAQRVTVKNAGHICNLCNPDGYNTALEEFLGGLNF